MAGLDFQINRAPTPRGSDPNKFRHQERADTSLSKFRKDIQLLNPAARSAMLNSVKRATERNADQFFIFFECHEHKTEPVIIDDVFDNRSNLGKVGLYPVLAQLTTK